MDEPGDLYLLGLVSNENDYRLSWQINQHLKVGLTRLEDIKIEVKGSEQDFIVYTYTDENKYMQLTFFKNKSSSNVYLLPEHKSCDFFLCIQGSLYTDEYEKMVKSIKEMPVVSMVMKIEMKSLKSRKHLIFL